MPVPSPARSYDYIIIGAGSSGCAPAPALSGATLPARAGASPARGTDTEPGTTADTAAAESDLRLCRDWRYTATIACTGIGDNFFRRMPEQIKARTEENPDGRRAHERDANEAEKDADPEPQFRAPAGQRRGWWRRSERRSVAAAMLIGDERDRSDMAEYGEWNRKGAVLSDVTAQKEYGVTRDFIVKGVQAGELEFRKGAVWGNPYLRVLRSQLERYIVAQLGSEYLVNKKSHNELHAIRKEISEIRKKLAVLEARKAALECAIKT